VNRFGLEGRHVVVAGAGGGGIGTAVSRLLAEEGASVTGLDNRPEALGVLEEALRGTAGPHRLVVADVRNVDDVTSAVAEAASGGALHGLVHVAGGMWPQQWSSLLDADITVFDEVAELNFRSALVTMREVARQLVAGGRGGSIVSVSSVAGLTAMPYGMAYAASKAALVSLTRTAALEWGSYGIRVNSVAPGSVQTPKTSGGRTAGGVDSTPRNEAERSALPLRRRGRPEDIAGAILYLMSDLANWVTGQVLAVDGGSSARPSFLGPDDLPVFVQSAEMRERLVGNPASPSGAPS
jgi:3-oxoacyl-[acyl-carrier protein] reductase